MDEWYIGSFLQSVRLIRLVFFLSSRLFRPVDIILEIHVRIFDKGNGESGFR